MKLYNHVYLKIYRQDLRNNMPNAELLLWKYLRYRQLYGFKFRRQYSIGNYIVDFYCSKKKLVIELDGESHYEGVTKQQKDLKRDEYLKAMNIKVFRYLNTDIYANLSGVLEDIMTYLKQ